MKRRMLLGGNSNVLKRFLSAYYKFNNNANDSSAWNPINFGSVGTYATGKLSQAIDTIDGLSLAHTGTFFKKFSFENRPFGISVWIKIEGYNIDNLSYIFTKGGVVAVNNSFEYFFGVLTATKKLLFRKYSAENAYRSITADFVFSLDTWYHIVITDGGSVGTEKIYINGSEVSTTKTTTGSYTSMTYTSDYCRFFNSTSASSSGKQFYGYADDLAFFNGYAPTAQDVSFLYNSGNGREIR